uniref:Secreted protein n=1 Tax=Bursaphelenchus xylophilus TaxID=6326 RepID=A0A1I7SGR2_BURXY
MPAARKSSRLPATVDPARKCPRLPANVDPARKCRCWPQMSAARKVAARKKIARKVVARKVVARKCAPALFLTLSFLDNKCGRMAPSPGDR